MKSLARSRMMLGLLGFMANFAQICQADRASFQGLGHLPSGFESYAMAISADGSVVVGDSGRDAFRWTVEAGMESLVLFPGRKWYQARGVSADGTTVVGRNDTGFLWTAEGGIRSLPSTKSAEDVSADGSVVVGSTENSQFGDEPFRWTAQDGVQRLGYLPGGGRDAAAMAVSADGSVVVGYGYSNLARERVPFRWTAEDGMQSLGDTEGMAWDVSADGSVVVGAAYGVGVFRWTAETGMVALGPGTAYAVSPDGSVVVGESSDGDAFIWDRQNGMRNLKQILENEYGLDLAGWDLYGAIDVSADGLTVIGNGYSPSGYDQGWIATLPKPPMLTGLQIAGPNEVLAWSSAQYNAVAYYDNGSSKDATASTVWSLKQGTHGSIDETGLFTLEALHAPVQTTISAQYTEHQITVDAQKLVSCIPRARPGQTYYVDAIHGDNRNNGLTPETPFATIQKGIDSSRDGDTVLVYPAVYTEEIRFRGKAITVRSAADAAILQNPNDFAVSFYYGEGAGSILKNFVIRNSLTGIFIVASSPTIHNVTVVNNEYGIEAHAGAEPDVSNCILWNNAEADLIGCDARYSWVQEKIEPEPIEGLLSLWTFDEGQGDIAYDSAGYNHGTVYGARWTTGYLGGALRFDGVDDYVSLSSNGVVSTEFTISAWANQQGLAGGTLNTNIIFSQRDDITGNDRCAIALLTERSYYSPYAAAGIRSSNGSVQALDHPTRDYDQWHHYAMTVSANDFAFYVDAAEVGRTPNQQAGDYVTSIDYVTIGRARYEQGNVGFFNGAIDEVAVWDRALSAEEIQQLYRYRPSTDPLFVDPAKSDYHLRSERGRYWPEHDVWVLDEVTSPCVDAGDPTGDCSGEPKPNGGRINMGAYGGTGYASMSEWPVEGDVNRDGIINISDVITLIENWLESVGWAE